MNRGQNRECVTEALRTVTSNFVGLLPDIERMRYDIPLIMGRLLGHLNGYLVRKCSQCAAMRGVIK